MLAPLLLALGLSATPKLELSTSQFASQYGYIRALQETAEKPLQTGVREAVIDLGALEKTFPSSFTSRTGLKVSASSVGQDRVSELYWRMLDALVFSSDGPERLGAISQMLPKIGGELDTDAALRLLTRALAESKQDYISQIWPGAQRIARKQIEAVEAIPASKLDAATEFILKSASISTTPGSVDILVLPRMAGKEGITVRTRSGTRVVIGAGKYAGSDFIEVVLHESTHMFDSSAGENSLFKKLRAALTAAHRSPFELEQVPHVCMFLLAAEATRRFVDPAHKDVGETFGAYSRGLEPLRKIVAPELRKLISGEPLDQAVSHIVAALPPQP